MKSKVFVSYTIRDGFITKRYLVNIEKKLSKNFNVFIDMLDNDSNNQQIRVIKELIDSDIVLLIKTCDIYKSPWVRLELSLAIKNRKPILIVDSYNL